jgi:hypothetical protein
MLQLLRWLFHRQHRLHACNSYYLLVIKQHMQAITLVVSQETTGLSYHAELQQQQRSHPIKQAASQPCRLVGLASDNNLSLTDQLKNKSTLKADVVTTQGRIDTGKVMAVGSPAQRVAQGLPATCTSKHS